MPSIAIVGLACVYPDARTPVELWENVLAQRRAFRRLPAERLRVEDYWSADPATPDSTYSLEAAVIEGYEFDRVGFRVVGSTFRSADLAHWLALDVASRALADAGFPEGRGLPRQSTGVLLGNTLTGEFSRANALRLRWPYVRRVVEAALTKEGWASEAQRKFLAELETEYKSPFPSVGEESLAGGLSNTIAGRICNQFDFKGGGYTVDGACASSLLAVANACTALVTGDLDVALAGGVDLSLDPFELVGFAKTGALAPDEMRVFDRRSAGFWPGEGCGFVALMRHEDALAKACRVYAVIRGWGVSSDGSGGMTRPEAQGQIEALRRAYRRAGFGIDTVTYCEGHGTGTAVGDATELEVLSRARREARMDCPPAIIGSIKANIGHTKAAAGIAGLIKASMAVHTQVLPPTTGCQQPHPLLTGSSPALRVLGEAEPWPENRPLRACVSAMGFGGINAHVVLEATTAERRRSLTPRERSLSRSQQDAELFLLSAETFEDLARQIDQLLLLAGRISRAELTDLAARLEQILESRAVRAAIVASTPAELAARLQTLRSLLEKAVEGRSQFADGVSLGSGQSQPRIAFLFPGQASPTHLDGGLWPRCFEAVRNLYSRADLPAAGDPVSTRVMQPAVVTASLAGLKMLEEFGISADAAIGHSLGELTALHWAGVLEEEALARIVRARGALMAELGVPTGGMLAIAAPCTKVQTLLNGNGLAIVGFNSPRQTVVAGQIADINHLAERAAAMGWEATRLPVSHAFHTPLVAAAVPGLAEQLTRETFEPIKRAVFSTVTGALLGETEDLPALLCRQVTSPVRFSTALAALLTVDSAIASAPGTLQREFDLLIEVGPGTVLRDLAQEVTRIPALALDAGGSSFHGLLHALGAAFALGAPLRHEALFAGRFTRPFSLDWKPKFFANPCELAPLSQLASKGTDPNPVRGLTAQAPLAPHASPITHHTPITPLELIRQLVAHRAELPASEVQDSHRMLSDLHLNSISVGQLVSEAARQLGVPRIIGLTDFANASVADMVRALEELQRTGATASETKKQQPAGVDVWIETFTVELVEASLKQRSGRDSTNALTHQGWQVFAPSDHPLAAPLSKKLSKLGGAGVLVCLPENPIEEHFDLLLDSVRALRTLENDPRFILVQHGWGGAGFARTLHLETPNLTTCIVNVPANLPQAVDWIAAEVAVAIGFVEAHYDAQGRRCEPKLRTFPPVGGVRPSYPIGPDDVLLVTGGGKGIAAECALAIGRATHASLALLGRSDPKTDSALAENLARIAAAGIRCCYVRADVTDASAVGVAVAEAEQKLGPVTALLHGAGTNTPQLIDALDTVAFRRTLAPKIQGARNVLAALDTSRLRLLITFGSIIARAGLRGEADYATANEWMTAMTERFQSQHPQCRCLALEWSVWADVGMGQRLGRIESLMQEGIMPIPSDEGVRILLDLLRRSLPSVAVVISGRFGDTPTLTLSQPELPLRRFLERTRVYYPGIELIVDADLSVEADPYLNDHAVQKQRLLPAVLGLEAIAQVAMALSGSSLPPNFERIELQRPVAISDKHPTTIRLAALRRGPDLIEVCLRSDETDFQVDHFRALCRFIPGKHAPTSSPSRITHQASRIPLPEPRDNAELLPLVPLEHLYGNILFHQGRFCRLDGYLRLQAKECIARIIPGDGAAWFGPYLPQQFVLGDPAIRDAALHAIQACIPHRRILPTGIDELIIHRSQPGVCFVRAKERAHEGNDFTYDLEITDASGDLIETWVGLRLRAVEALTPPEVWPESLLAPYLERRLEELVASASLSVAFESDGAHVAGTNSLLQQALGVSEQVFRRPDGKPVVPGQRQVSAAHCQGFTLAVSGETNVACDLEAIAPRSESVWFDLLGEARFKLAARISREQTEGLDTTGTRVWTACECLKKAGLAAEAPLLLESRADDGWVLLRSGSIIIATLLARVQGMSAPSIIALLSQSRTPALRESAASLLPLLDAPAAPKAPAT